MDGAPGRNPRPSRRVFVDGEVLSRSRPNANRNRDLQYAGTGEPFVGWVQPTANGVRPVGCTHPTMTQSLPCVV